MATLLAIWCGLSAVAPAAHAGIPAPAPPVEDTQAGEERPVAQQQGQVAYGPVPGATPDSEDGDDAVPLPSRGGPVISFRGGYGAFASDLDDSAAWIAVAMGWPRHAVRRGGRVLSYRRPGSPASSSGPDPRFTEWGIGVEGRTGLQGASNSSGLRLLAGMRGGMLRFSARNWGPVIGAPGGHGSSFTTSRDFFLAFTPYAGAAMVLLESSAVSTGVRLTAGLQALSPKSLRGDIPRGSHAPGFFVDLGLEVTATPRRRGSD